MPLAHAKMRLKSAPQKLDFAMVKAITKSYTLDYMQLQMPLNLSGYLHIVTQPLLDKNHFI